MLPIMLTIRLNLMDMNTSRDVAPKFGYRYRCQNWYIWFKNSQNSREKWGTEQLHFPYFVNDVKICPVFDLMTVKTHLY